VFYGLQLLLFIELDGGSRQVYSCTNPAAADACAQTSPTNPAEDPNCVLVDK